MIHLNLSHLKTINDCAEAAYPFESCGLLAGTRNKDGVMQVTRVVTSPNIADQDSAQNLRDRFEVDPKVRFDLMRELQGSDQEIIGHYHSHPEHAAKPSKRDIDMAFEPDLVWLITAVVAGHAGRTRAWRLNRETQAATPVDMVINEGTA